MIFESERPRPRTARFRIGCYARDASRDARGRATRGPRGGRRERGREERDRRARRVVGRGTGERTREVVKRDLFPAASPAANVEREDDPARVDADATARDAHGALIVKLAAMRETTGFDAAGREERARARRPRDATLCSKVCATRRRIRGKGSVPQTRPRATVAV